LNKTAGAFKLAENSRFEMEAVYTGKKVDLKKNGTKLSIKLKKKKIRNLIY
jgi:hypothetical protein